jgi:hypothetical protein
VVVTSYGFRRVDGVVVMPVGNRRRYRTEVRDLTVLGAQNVPLGGFMSGGQQLTGEA